MSKTLATNDGKDLGKFSFTDDAIATGTTTMKINAMNSKKTEREGGNERGKKRKREGQRETKLGGWGSRWRRSGGVGEGKEYAKNYVNIL